MPYRHIIDGCLADRIGEGGLTATAFDRARTDAVAAASHLRHSQDRALTAVLSSVSRDDDLADISEWASLFRNTCQDVFVIGTGGSSLGARTLCALADEQKPRLHFLENVDPVSLEKRLAATDPSETGVIAISKSGGTLETVSITMIVLDWLKKKCGAAEISGRTLVITGPAGSPLSRLASKHGIPILDHDADIGGRYSVFSAVGLLPAMIAGVDGAAVRTGADRLLTQTFEAPKGAAAIDGAALVTALAAERGVAMSVLMPYQDRLADLSLWYRQLWAESLGKEGKGTTPVQASGTVDQHSQLQLYLDGPADKLVSLVTVPSSGHGPTIPAELAQDAGLGDLMDRPIGDLLDAFSGATADALMECGRPVRIFSADRLDPSVLGELLMHFMLETLVTSALWGVNPFGQPAVEAGKNRARARLAASAEDAA